MNAVRHCERRVQRASVEHISGSARCRADGNVRQRGAARAALRELRKRGVARGVCRDGPPARGSRNRDTGVVRVGRFVGRLCVANTGVCGVQAQVQVGVWGA